MRLAALGTLTIALIACSGNSPAEEQAGQPQGKYQAGAQAPTSDARPFQVAPVADFEAPWAMTFLPDGRMLVTEKAGRMLLVSADGRQRRALTGVPAVDSAGQGGLMDVVLAPGFAQNGQVYFSFSEAGLYLWATRDEDCWATVERLARRGILAAPGAFYGPSAARHVRIALTATDERVAAAADRLAEPFPA